MTNVLEEYPGYTLDNLDTRNVWASPAGHLLVHKDHPAVTVLRCNKEILCPDVDLDVVLLEGIYFKMPPPALRALNNTIRYAARHVEAV